MIRIATRIPAVAVMLALVVANAWPQDASGKKLPVEYEVYLAVFRTAIELRLAQDRREGLAFFLSLSPADSVQPERRKFLIKDAPSEILRELSRVGLPVKPGSQAIQPQPKQQLLDSETMRPGIRVVLNRVTWESDAEALVYCEIYSHGRDASGKIFRVRNDGGEWSIVSVDPKWES